MLHVREYCRSLSLGAFFSVTPRNYFLKPRHTCPLPFVKLSETRWVRRKLSLPWGWKCLAWTSECLELPWEPSREREMEVWPPSSHSVRFYSVSYFPWEISLPNVRGQESWKPYRLALYILFLKGSGRPVGLSAQASKYQDHTVFSTASPPKNVSPLFASFQVPIRRRI